ncbi:hypothetical protein [Paenibacillus sp. FSL R7-0179]|uniref:hypothetical protein n=1 Tax=Paenibacillus sp. FSL R7-0179 TaxID=2921672 RepID=UPI0030FACD09
MKKRLGILISAFLLLSSIPAYANSNEKFSTTSNDEYEIIYQKEEITDSTLLLERAKNGITDKATDSVARSAVNEIKGKITNAETNLSDDLNVYDTVQKLKEYKSKTTDITYTDYAMTSIAVTPMAGNPNSKSISGWDLHDGVQGFATIYYTTENVSYAGQTLPSVLLTKVSWRFERSDGTIVMPTALYRYGNNGSKITGGPSSSNQVYEANYSPVISGETKTIVQNFGWTPVLASSFYYPSVGLFVDLTLTRGTSTWHFTLNNLFN